MARKQLALAEYPTGAGIHRDWRRGRLELVWTAGELGIPSANADIVSATEATAITCDRDFEIIGTNSSTDDMVHRSSGGLRAQTDGADNDQIILVPHQDTGQSPWSSVTWGSDQETRWEALIRTPDDILTGLHLMFGLKSDLDMGLDDSDLIMFNYNGFTLDDGDNTWGVVANVDGGTASDTDSGIPVTGGRFYQFMVDFDNAGCAHCFIDGILVAEVDFAGASADLKPVCAVQSLSATADEFYIFEQKIGRNYA